MTSRTPQRGVLCRTPTENSPQTFGLLTSTARRLMKLHDLGKLLARVGAGDNSAPTALNDDQSFGPQFCDGTLRRAE